MEIKLPTDRDNAPRIVRRLPGIGRQTDRLQPRPPLRQHLQDREDHRSAQLLYRDATLSATRCLPPMIGCGQATSGRP